MRIALAAFEVAAAKVAVSFHVSDGPVRWLRGISVRFDGLEDAAFLSRDEDAARIWGVVPAVSLVDIAALDLPAGEPLGVLDDGAQGVAVIRDLPGSVLACSTNWPPGARILVVMIEALTPNS